MKLLPLLSILSFIYTEAATAGASVGSSPGQKTTRVIRTMPVNSRTSNSTTIYQTKPLEVSKERLTMDRIQMDFVQAIHGSVAPNINDKVQWAGGTLTRLGPDKLEFKSNNGTFTQILDAASEFDKLARLNKDVNDQWISQYGIDVAKISSTPEAIQARLRNDFYSAIRGNIAPNIGDHLEWAGGTLTRTAVGQLKYVNGSFSQTLDVNTDFIKLAKDSAAVNAAWISQYGIDVAKMNAVAKPEWKIVDPVSKQEILQATNDFKDGKISKEQYLNIIDMVNNKVGPNFNLENKGPAACTSKEQYIEKYKTCVPQYASACNPGNGYQLKGTNECLSNGLGFTFDVR